MKHNPQYKYDCDNCKFNWCCGYVCACNLRQLPEPPEHVVQKVKEAQDVRRRAIKSNIR